MHILIALLCIFFACTANQANAYISSNAAIRDSITAEEVVAIARENNKRPWIRYECDDFVKEVFSAAGKSFSSLTPVATKPGFVTDKSWFSNVKVGDALHFDWDFNGGSGPHYVIVTAINANTISWMDNSGNYDPDKLYANIAEIQNKPLTTFINRNRVRNVTVYHFTPTPIADLAGNDFPAARNLGNLGQTAVEISDWVGLYDRDDYYRFRVSWASKVKVTLAGYGDVDVAAYAKDSSGTPVRYSQSVVPKTRIDMPNSWQTQETFTLSCVPGVDYYVRVYGNLADNKYILWARTLDDPIRSDGAGNSFDAAKNIGVLPTLPAKYRDSVGTSDPNDYYRFQVLRGGNLTVSLTGHTQAVYIDLFNSAKTRIKRSVVGGTNKIALYENLTPGTYYAKVYIANINTNTNYDLFMSCR